MGVCQTLSNKLDKRSPPALYSVTETNKNSNDLVVEGKAMVIYCQIHVPTNCYPTLYYSMSEAAAA